MKTFSELREYKKSTGKSVFNKSTTRASWTTATGYAEFGNNNFENPIKATSTLELW